jgi:hypothetical protein
MSRSSDLLLSVIRYWLNHTLDKVIRRCDLELGSGSDESAWCLRNAIDKTVEGHIGRQSYAYRRSRSISLGINWK